MRINKLRDAGGAKEECRSVFPGYLNNWEGLETNMQMKPLVFWKIRKNRADFLAQMIKTPNPEPPFL